MRNIVKYKLFESKVNRIIKLLKELSLEMKDDGYTVDIHSGSSSFMMLPHYSNIDEYKVSNKFIYVEITYKKYHQYPKTGQSPPDIRVTEEEFKSKVENFIEDCKSFGLNPSGRSYWPWCYQIRFKKWGKMTDSEYLKESVITDEIENINDILIELKDEGWLTYVDYVPFRWIPVPKHKGIFHKRTGRDYLNITIKKSQNKNNSVYPEGSDFEFSRIEDYVYRIIDVYKDNKLEFMIINPEEYNNKFNTSTGKYYDIKIENVNELDNILGFIIKIELDGQDLDDFNYPKKEEA